MVRARRDDARPVRHGWTDAARQVLLFLGAYVLYQLVRGLVNHEHAPQLAALNATKVIDFERGLHVFVEPGVEHWAMHFHLLMDLATWFYLNGNYAITGGALVWIYLRRNGSFYFVRNMFLVAMAIALVGYAVFPTAPPRLMSSYGFTDVIRQVTGVDPEQGTASIFVNMYAAIPSMHVCFALMAGGPMCRFCRTWAARAAWALYPPFVAFVVVATANHYLTDVALGAATAGLSGLAARELLARARPHAWAFRHAGRHAGVTDHVATRRQTLYAVEADAGADTPRTPASGAPSPPRAPDGVSAR